MRTERFYHTMTRITGAGPAESVKAWVLIAGGISGIRTVQPSVEVYVPPQANE